MKGADEMTYYDEQLQLLQQQTAESARLESKLRELYNQRDQLSEKVLKLKVQKDAEQADVDRLNGRSLAAFFYEVVGKKQEKLDAELREARAAAVKYDAAACELAEVERDIQGCLSRLEALRGCQERYTRALREKADAMKAAGTPMAEEVFSLEEYIARFSSREKEINEAIAAGLEAKSTAAAVVSKLNSAENWGIFDVVSGGLLLDLIKHEKLDEAQSLVEQLQNQLRRFKTELADVTVQADLHVTIDGFLFFADYIFDDLFSDWLVLERIQNSRARAQGTLEQIEAVLTRLHALREEVRQERKRTEERLNETILGVKL